MKFQTAFVLFSLSGGFVASCLMGLFPGLYLNFLGRRGSKELTQAVLSWPSRFFCLLGALFFLTVLVIGLHGSLLR